MQSRRTVVPALLAVVATFTIAACGSSGTGTGDAQKLLNQTFSGAHSVNSGNLSFSLTLTPSGSRTLTSPISLSFGGPFQSLGTGKLPESNFEISVSAVGRRGSLSILSTGTSGYVTLQGKSYQLPAATFQKLETSFAQVTASGGGNGSGTFSRLGISPLRWLNDPSVVGHDAVGGATTTHIRAAINVNALLADLNTFMQRASALGVSGTSSLSNGLSPTTRSRIASQVTNPTVDVWTGTADKTLRRMVLGLGLPVSGRVSTSLGGLTRAQIGLEMKYANLNQPQTITAPATVRPFREFTTKLSSFLAAVQSAGASAGAGTQGTASGPAGAGATGAAAPTATTGAAGASATVHRYSVCLQAAGQDVAKMQRCASLLNGR
jgi:hypothetical protein